MTSHSAPAASQAAGDLALPGGAPSDSGDEAPARRYTVLIYSDAPTVRDGLRAAIGRRPAPELGRIEYVEATTGEAVISVVDKGGVDVCLLDGEAWPTGGMGISRQLKNEIRNPPATIVVVARRDDVWLARWSTADAVLAHPLDPVEVADTVAAVLRRRAAGLPAVI